jgi:hypothetical protein
MGNIHSAALLPNACLFRDRLRLTSRIAQLAEG